MSKYFTIKGIEEDEIFRNLFIDYYPSLISFALYYVGDKTIAEDLVQEVFVKLWKPGNVGVLSMIFLLMSIRWSVLSVLIIYGQRK